MKTLAAFSSALFLVCIGFAQSPPADVGLYSDPAGSNQIDLSIAQSPVEPSFLVACSSVQHINASGGIDHSNLGVYVNYAYGCSWGPCNDAVIADFEGALSPRLAFNAEGRVFLCYQKPRGEVRVVSSGDGMQSLSLPTQVDINTNYAGATIAIDRTGGPYNDRIYVAYAFSGDDVSIPRSPTWSGNFDLRLRYSTDGGVTFVPATNNLGRQYDYQQQSLGGEIPPNSPPCLAVGPDGDVYIVCGSADDTYDDELQEPTKYLFFLRSTDGGATFDGLDNLGFPTNRFQTVEWIGSDNVPYSGPIWKIKPSIPVGAHSWPSMAVDLSHGPHRGRIYVVWADDNGGSHDILMTYSDDKGATWSNAAVVNQDGTSGAVKDQWNPTVRVDVDGYVTVMYYDSRDDPNNVLTRIYLSRSSNGGATWTDTPGSAGSFTPAARLSTYAQLDFVAAHGGVYPIWSDSRSGHYEAYTTGFCSRISFGGEWSVDQELHSEVSIGSIDRQMGEWKNSSWEMFTPPALRSFAPNTASTFKVYKEVWSSQKHQYWRVFPGYLLRDVPENYVNVRTLSFAAEAPQQIVAQEEPVVEHNLVRNRFNDEASITGGTIGFRDPYYIDFQDLSFGSEWRNRGIDATMRYVSSPFQPSIDLGKTDDDRRGVFMGLRPRNDAGDPWHPYYAFSATPLLLPSLDRQAPNDSRLAIGDWFLTDIDAASTSSNLPELRFADAGHADTAVTWKDDNETVYADYKRHLSTTNDQADPNAVVHAAGLPSNSERAIIYHGRIEPPMSTQGTYVTVQTPHYAMIYVENGKLYFSTSMDNGGTWDREIRLDVPILGNDDTRFKGYVGSASMCLRSDGALGIIYECTHLVQYPSDAIADPLLVLVVGTPLYGTFGYTWAVTPLTDASGNWVFGSQPVIAPQVSGNAPLNPQWWVSWVHTRRNSQAEIPDFASRSNLTIPTGIYVATANATSLTTTALRLTNSNCDNCVLPVVGANPTVSASFLDPLVGTGNTTFNFKGMLNAAEGMFLHIAWDWGGSILYNTIMADASGLHEIGVPEVPGKWAFATYELFSATGSRFNFTTSRKPCLGVDDYLCCNWTNPASTPWEEPVVAWELLGLNIMYGGLGVVRDPLSQVPLGLSGGNGVTLRAVAMNRRGDWQSLTALAQKPWANTKFPREYAQLFVTSVPHIIDHPSVATFPLDDKSSLPNQQYCGGIALVKNDLQAALAFRVNVGNTAMFGTSHPLYSTDFTGLGYSFFQPLPNSACPLGPYQVSFPSPFDPAWCTTNPQQALGMVEPHLSYGKYGVVLPGSEFWPNMRSTRLLYKESGYDGLLPSPNTVSMYNFNTPTTQLGFGKVADLQADFATLSDDYLGTTVDVDTLGTVSLLLGEVSTSMPGQAPVKVPVHLAALDSGGPRPDSATLDKFVRTATFSLVPGQMVTAATYVLGDSMGLARIMDGAAVVLFSVDLVDSADGAVLIPMFQLRLGGHQDSVQIPTIFPTFTYNGPPSNAVYVRVLASVLNLPDSLVGIAGLSVHTISADGGGLGKMARHDHPYSRFAFLPTENLLVFPNPSGGWTQCTYSVYDRGEVEIRLADVLGREVRSIARGVQENGRYAVSFNTDDVPPGFYQVSVYVDSRLSGKGGFFVRR